ncbi:hypothetical protein ABW20_dc0106230 [Dactylellina cionopaga]|nr:hypothetical protein ABW20_dc0106230 [Dactylellina cionopaga]
MSASQECLDKPPQADTTHHSVTSGQGAPANAPTGPRNQSRRGSYQGYNGRSNSNGPYNDNRNRSSSSGRGGRGGGGGGRGTSRGKSRNGLENDQRNNYRSQSSGGSPYRGGYNSSGGSRSASQGPLNTTVPDFNGGPGSQAPGGGSLSSRPETPGGLPNNNNSYPNGGRNSPSQNNWNNRGGSRPNSNNRRAVSNHSVVVAQTDDLSHTEILTPGIDPTFVPQEACSEVAPASSEQQLTNPPATIQRSPSPIEAGPSTVPARPGLEYLDTDMQENCTTEEQQENMAIKKKKKRNKAKKKTGGKQNENAADGDEADNEGTSGSEEVSTSPLAIKFAADLVTASIITPESTITIIPVPGVPGGDPTIGQRTRIDESKANEGLANETIDPMLEEPRKDNRFKLLPTRRELLAAVEQMEVYTVVVHSRAANEVVTTIKKATDNLKEGIPDCQHLRRLVKPENLPPSLTGLPDSLFVDYSTENQSPSVKVNPDGSVENVTRSRGASRAQRRRRNASYRKGEKPLYVLLCPVVTMTIRELYEALSTHPMFAGVDLDCEIPFDSQDIPQITRHTVPQWAPCNLKQANYWTEKYWPTIYRRTNPYGPHPFLTTKWEDRLHHPYPIDEMDYVEYDGTQISMGEYYMRLARKVAEEGEQKGDGLRIGCVVVELKDREGPRHGKVMAVAHDARIKANNPLAHACYRTISLVGRKRVEVTARHKPKVNMYALNAPNSPMEDDYYGRVPGDPDGYLMNDLIVFMTHEPCIMCSMAMVHSRIGCLVYDEPMVSGGLHADLAPSDGHSLPYTGVTDEDVAAYRARHGIAEPEVRQRRTGDESLLGGGGEEATSEIQREKDVSFFKAVRAALIAEREIQEEEALAKARIVANQETTRKGNTMDKGTQTTKIFDSIKDGEDYLGARAGVKLGVPDSKDKATENRDESTDSLTKENFQQLTLSGNAGDAVSLNLDGGPPIYDPVDGGKFSQTRSVFDSYAKSGADTSVIVTNLVPRIEEEEQGNKVEEETALLKGERIGDLGITKVDSSRDGSPEGFGGLGIIDVTGVNEDSTLTTAAEEQEEGKGKGLAVDKLSTAGAERGRSRTPAPFKPGTGDFVPVNISYGSPPHPSESSPDNDFTTSGGEETAGTGCDEDSDLGIGDAFDLITIEAPDTAEKNPAEGSSGEKKKKKKKRSRAKKKTVVDEKTASSQTEGFEMVNVDEFKDISVKAEPAKNSFIHGSSTTAPSDPSSREVNEDHNTGTTFAHSRPHTPNGDSDDSGENGYGAAGPEEEKEESELDELVKPTVSYRLLKEKIDSTVPKYDHGQGDGYGLFWREKLNWKFLCFRYNPSENEKAWDTQLEWQGATNDGLHA